MWRFLQISKNGLQLKLKLRQLWRIAMLPIHDCMNFKLELVFLRIMWVFGHFFTCQPTWSQLETFNLIGVNVIIKKKSSKVNGEGKKHRSVPEVFLAVAPLVASAFGQHRKFPPHARKTSGTQGTRMPAVTPWQGVSLTGGVYPGVRTWCYGKQPLVCYCNVYRQESQERIILMENYPLWYHAFISDIVFQPGITVITTLCT